MRVDETIASECAGQIPQGGKGRAYLRHVNGTIVAWWTAALRGKHDHMTRSNTASQSRANLKECARLPAVCGLTVLFPVT